MQQILTFHGGEVHPTYDAYLAYLKAFPLTFDDMNRAGWRSGLGKVLGDNYEVIGLRLPNSLNAKYQEWKIWTDKALPLVQDDVILVGHSLGTVFLVKYLSEVEPVRKVKATFLVAAPYTDSEKASEYLGEFVPPKDKSAFAARAGKIFLYHSEDDEIVPFSSLADYQRVLPNATTRSFKDRGHFLGEEFPELVTDIHKLG